MRRRVFLASLGLALTFPAPGRGQDRQPKLIGWLAPEPRPIALAAFRQALTERGWGENRAFSIMPRYSQGAADRYPILVDELLRLNTDILVVDGSPAARAAQQATTKSPIVFVTGDPVSQGFVASLARPGGNLTGVAIIAADLNPKRMQLLKEAVPTMTRLGILEDSSAARSVTLYARLGANWQAVESAARQLGLQLNPATQVRQPEELEDAFGRLKRERSGGVLVLPSALFSSLASRIAGLAAQSRLPVVYEHQDFVEAGGLMSYGPSPRDVFRRVAQYVDRILKGATPADLPVEQADKVELVVNLKSAKALGLVLPQALLSRADRVLK